MNDLLDFGGYLIDNFEGTVIREETIMILLDSFVKSDYNKKGKDIISETIVTTPTNKYKIALEVYKEFDTYDENDVLVFSDWIHAKVRA